MPIETPLKSAASHKKKNPRTVSFPKNLLSLKPGQVAKITGYGEDVANNLRLAEMGIILGAMVRLVKQAPFGGPLQLAVRGFHLSISQRIAQAIFVQS